MVKYIFVHSLNTFVEEDFNSITRGCDFGFDIVFLPEFCSTIMLFLVFTSSFLFANFLETLERNLQFR